MKNGNTGLHEVKLMLDQAERPKTVHELARILLTWVDGPVPQSAKP